jgi:hypothetical protein
LSCRLWGVKHILDNIIGSGWVRVLILPILGKRISLFFPENFICQKRWGSSHHVVIVRTLDLFCGELFCR